MKVYVDADACPVIDEAIIICNKFSIKIVIVCDDSHMINREVEIIVVEKGFDSSDYKILSLLCEGDLVITNDYGLSALVLAKKCSVINFDGKIILENEIDAMLASRAFNAKMRKANIRFKGPSKRSIEQNKVFKTKLESFLLKTTNN
ncbi:MAG: DUF188 domain-containing protein [Bacilli bacterium]